MAFTVWIIGVGMILSFVAGVRTETDVFTTAASVGFTALIAWSVAVYLVAIGYSEGKRKR